MTGRCKLPANPTIIPTASSSSSSTSRPPAPAEDEDLPSDVERLTRSEWRKRNKKAKRILVAFVSEAIADTIAHYETATEMWQYLVDKYDRKNNFNLVTHIKNITSLRLNSEDTVASHVAKFEAVWGRLEKRLLDVDSTRDGSLEKVLKDISRSDETKAAIFVSSFPDDDKWDQVLDNCTSSGLKTYTEVRTRHRQQQRQDDFSERTFVPEGPRT